jgi:hypothetical protein
VPDTRTVVRNGEVDQVVAEDEVPMHRLLDASLMTKPPWPESPSDFVPGPSLALWMATFVSSNDCHSNWPNSVLTDVLFTPAGPLSLLILCDCKIGVGFSEMTVF